MHAYTLLIGLLTRLRDISVIKLTRIAQNLFPKYFEEIIPVMDSTNLYFLECLMSDDREMSDTVMNILCKRTQELDEGVPYTPIWDKWSMKINNTK